MKHNCFYESSLFGLLFEGGRLLFYFLDSLVNYYRLASNFWSSSLSLLNARIIAISHHAHLNQIFIMILYHKIKSHKDNVYWTLCMCQLSTFCVVLDFCLNMWPFFITYPCSNYKLRNRAWAESKCLMESEAGTRIKSWLLNTAHFYT